MARFVSKTSHDNCYLKNSIVYTEDHIPVQKLYFSKVPPELNQSILEHHFRIYGRVLRLQIFKPSSTSRRN
ncbi:uncharacterized protein LOC128256646 [Drosophila gunungcola]|uniref:uncharacterized protein LOC128256646 n=1 Tax=Drosophila gunungcola TaxID=103775 RepID=UPI0022E1426B|nr:uncharacterized protein LOC128256646 [Drosophila gunungcola]